MVSKARAATFSCAGCSLHKGAWPQGRVGAEIQPMFYCLSSGPDKKPCRSAALVLLRPAKLRLLVGHGWLCQVVLLRAELWSWSPLCALGPGGGSPVSEQNSYPFLSAARAQWQ